MGTVIKEGEAADQGEGVTGEERSMKETKKAPDTASQRRN